MTPGQTLGVRRLFAGGALPLLLAASPADAAISNYLPSWNNTATQKAREAAGCWCITKTRITGFGFHVEGLLHACTGKDACAIAAEAFAGGFQFSGAPVELCARVGVELNSVATFG